MTFDYDLTGKVALVTGGAIGLGNEYVETLAGQGCDVAIVDVNIDKAISEAARIQDETGHHIKAYYGDVGNEADVIKFVGEIVQDFGMPAFFCTVQKKMEKILTWITLLRHGNAS